MLLKFHLDSSERKFSLAKIAFGLSRLPDAEKNVVFFYHVGNDFPSPIGMSFNCTRETALDLTDSEYSTTSVGTIRISNLQLEAFNRKNSTAFSNAIDCDAVDRFPLGKNSSWMSQSSIPIELILVLPADVAAIVLASVGLAVALFVAFILARRNIRSHGYASMWRRGVSGRKPSCGQRKKKTQNWGDFLIFLYKPICGHSHNNALKRCEFMN